MLPQVRSIAIALLLLASAIALTMYLAWYPVDSTFLDPILDVFFDNGDRQSVMRAPPLLNFSVATWVLTWAMTTALVAIAFLVRALMKPAGDERGNLARSAVIIINLLTLFCLSALLPWLLRIFRLGFIA